MKKRIIISLVVAVLAILVLLFWAYEKISAPELQQQETENSAGNNIPGLEVELGEGAQNPGGFSICVDKCGDNFCQTSDPDCTNSLNCICLETPQECPQDCK